MDHLNFEQLSVKRLAEDATLPTRAHPGDAGLDLYQLEDVQIEPGEGKMIRTGIAIALKQGFVGLVADRSSLAKKGLKTAGGVIDAGYRGEVHIVIWNISSQAVRLMRGDRVAQLLIFPIATPMPVQVESLDETARGAGGFGSTGK